MPTFQSASVALLLVLASLLCEHHASAQSCYANLISIVKAEEALLDVSLKRTYVLCPDTVYTPGKVDLNGEILSGDNPLTVRANAHVKCGEDGKSENNCVIDGTGSYAIFVVPLFAFNDNTTADNIVIEGVTIDNWVERGQNPIVVSAFAGAITFLDCIFSNNNVDPLFEIAEFRSTLRRKNVEVGERKGRFSYPGLQDNNGRRLSDADTDATDNSAVSTMNDRQLQDAAFTVTFEECLFDSNSPDLRSSLKSSLTLVRLRATVIFNTFASRVGTLDARFIRNKFVDNVWAPTDDVAGYRAMVDFYSTGNILFRDNCFLGSTVSNYGVIVAQAGSTVESEGNFIDPVQSELLCNFAALLNTDYDMEGCESEVLASSCVAEGALPPPPVAFCFPGDARCQVEGRGQVLMANIKLGDKILVQGGTYEPVYSFGHRDESSEVDYLTIVTSAPRPLEISKDHMVFLQGGRSVPASRVIVGDQLDLANGKFTTVRSIRNTKKKGAFSPFTSSGTVVVNGVKCSNFIAFQNSETLSIAGMDTGLTFQYFAHTFEGPHRLWCSYFSECKEEIYTAEGISTWVDLPHRMAQWFVEQNTVLMVVSSVPVLIFFAMLAYPVASMLTLTGILLLGRCQRVLLKFKSV